MSAECPNAFVGRLVLQSYQSTTVAALNFMMIPCTFAANLLVIVSLYKSRQLGTIINRFFFFLSISDCCVAAIVQSLVGALFTTYSHQQNCRLEIASQFLTFFFGHLSGFTVVAIGIDRYIHMKYLQRYDSIMTKKRAIVLLVISFTASIVMGASYTLSTIYSVYEWVNMAILLADFFAVLLIYAAYLQAYKQVKGHLKRTKQLRKSPNAPSYAIAMIMTILFILGAIFLCYVPYVIVGMLGFYRVQIQKRRLTPTLSLLTYLTYLLVYLNSCLNAVIFIYKNDTVRNYIMKNYLHKFGVKHMSQDRSCDTAVTSETSYHVKATKKSQSLAETNFGLTESTTDLLASKTVQI